MKRCLGSAAGLAAGFFLMHQTRAQTYYIDYERGSDQSSGRSAQQAFKHCPGDAAAGGRAAGTRLAPGDKVIFKGGVHYRSTVTIPSSGESDPPSTW